MLMLTVGEGVVYRDMFDEQLHGHVTKVVKWTGFATGFTYFVNFPDLCVGEFRWDDDCLSRDEPML
jgi:hypothetical protein